MIVFIFQDLDIKEINRIVFVYLYKIIIKNATILLYFERISYFKFIRHIIRVNYNALIDELFY